MPVEALEVAREQAAAEARNIATQTSANRPDQYNIAGSVEWTTEPYWDPVSGQYQNRWVQVETLADPLAATFSNQMAMGQLRSDMASAATARALRDYSTPMDFDQYGDPIQAQDAGEVGRFNYDLMGGRQAAEDAAYGRATSRLDPQFQQREQAMMTDLRNKGLSPGDQAYDAAMMNFNRSRNDAYEQARMGATLEGRLESQQDYGQQLGAFQTNLGAQGQQFGQSQQSAALANALRQQSMQEDVAQRGFNLAEADYIMGDYGVNVGPPGSGGPTTTTQQPNAQQPMP